MILRSSAEEGGKKARRKWIRLENAHVRLGGNRAEREDVISIESEVRGNREGDVSNAIDVYKKEEARGPRIEPWGTAEETSREEEVEPLTTTN